MEKLRPLTARKPRRGPVILCVMDGIGYSPYLDEGNAWHLAHTPTLDWLHANCPGIRLKAHGTAVGLPSDDDMGNSEVGHNAIGAGRTIAQGAKRVNAAIKSGEIFQGETWRALVGSVTKHDAALHFLGLLSDGNVHSNIAHLKAMLHQAKQDGVKTARVHALLDGRDVPPRSAHEYIADIEATLAELSDDRHDYRIASGGGRMQITMDRYNADWDMVARGWELHVHGEGRQFGSAMEAIETLREETGAIDQDLPGFVIADNGRPIGPIQDHDGVVMYNYRGDRAIEITNAFEDDDFDKFDRGRRPQVVYAGMMQYDPDTNCPARYLVEPPVIDRTIGEFIAAEGLKQMAVSEEQKYGHVTYFFNGNRSGKFADALETYECIDSDKVPFEQRPWMKAADITDNVIAAITDDSYDFIRVNYPNGDMVGHTGNILAATVAVSTVDLCLQRLLPVVRETGALLIVTADHGNAEDMWDRDKKSGEPKRDANGEIKLKTSHSLSPVPCLFYDPDFQDDYEVVDRDDLGIASLGPTCLNLLGFAAPDEYTDSIIDCS